MAVGTHKGYVQIWDAAAGKKLSVLEGHTARVGECGEWRDGSWSDTSEALPRCNVNPLTLPGSAVPLRRQVRWRGMPTSCHLEVAIG